MIPIARVPILTWGCIPLRTWYIPQLMGLYGLIWLVYIYIHIYIHTYIDIHMYIYIYPDIYIYMDNKPLTVLSGMHLFFLIGSLVIQDLRDANPTKKDIKQHASLLCRNLLSHC